ncbi:secoisolariciresinol dehydrogenase-like [Ipomoea triloba]|uniref:secoisolariciresinol dehydrogenase-like n=1 Tax=Ipomoea triloba TaxID=35885 RepID=UPI00125E7D5C|nr:secoisolariciresinol dehydrogenase-like [Ipomoea triloba]
MSSPCQYIIFHVPLSPTVAAFTCYASKHLFVCLPGSQARREGHDSGGERRRDPLHLQRRLRHGGGDAASKHAIVGLTKNLCVELGQYGIRVNCIFPGAVATPFAVKEIISASANLKGVVPAAEDVAEAALFLGSDESRVVSGLNLVVDGGYSTTNQAFITTMKQMLY